jgi:hypothetical protein
MVVGFVLICSNSFCESEKVEFFLKRVNLTRFQKVIVAPLRKKEAELMKYAYKKMKNVHI